MNDDAQKRNGSRRSGSTVRSAHDDQGPQCEKVVDEEKALGLGLEDDDDDDDDGDGDDTGRDTSRPGELRTPGEQSASSQAKALQHAKSLRSVRSNQSRAGADGYTCFDEEHDDHRNRPNNSSRATADEEPFLVSWDGDSDPLNPRSMTKLRRWAIVLIVSSSSLCV